MARTIQQERAAHAQQQVRQVRGKSRTLQDGFVSCAKELGSMIQGNGLGATLAFYRSRSTSTRPEYGEVAGALGRWLTSAGQPLAAKNTSGDALAAIVQADIEEYLAAQAEALAYSVWLKMFATSMLRPGAAGVSAPSGSITP